jgi:hypothetical protein
MIWMIKSGTKLKELREKLNSKNKKVISDAIISLRNAKAIRGAIGLLANYFDTSNDLTTKGLIRNFMNNIKEPGARIEVLIDVLL